MSQFEGARMSRRQRGRWVADIVVSSRGFMTERQIAKEMGVKKTPYLKSVLAELCEDGVLSCVWMTGVNGHPTRFFAKVGLQPVLFSGGNDE